MDVGWYSGLRRPGNGTAFCVLEADMVVTNEVEGG
jgi:hypothetical protein